MGNYQKLYAFLVGQVDDTIQVICENLMAGRHGFHELNAVDKKVARCASDSRGYVPRRGRSRRSRGRFFRLPCVRGAGTA